MQPVREVYSLLMPVQDGRIIVPRAAVAEVMGYTRPKERPADAPEFVLGFIEWQGQKIPLVSYEAARGRGVPELGRRTRIAVVFGIAGRLEPDVFAVVTQGYPYLVRVNENVLQREEVEGDDPLVLARVRMANERPLIPDFEKLEMLIAEALGITVVGDAGAANEPVDELDALGGADEEEFDAGAFTGDALDDEATMLGAEPEASDDAADMDLGAVTAFGTETNYASELDALSDALEADEEPEAGIDLGEVTAFGGETNYSVELDELADALQDDAAPADAEIDVSGTESDEEKEKPEDSDFSDFEIDFGDDEESKD